MTQAFGQRPRNDKNGRVLLLETRDDDHTSFEKKFNLNIYNNQLQNEKDISLVFGLDDGRVDPFF
jgi:hypothetical protein